MNLISSIKKIHKIIAADGIIWGGRNLFIKIKIILVSKYYQLAFNAKNIKIESPPVIRGARNIKFGSNIYVGGSIWIEAIANYYGFDYSPSISIGAGSSFSDGVHISAVNKIWIGSNVLMGSRVYISDHGHGQYKGILQSSPEVPPAKRPLGSIGSIIIEDNVWLGDNVIIVGDIKIGRGSIIGANSVVKHDVPANSLAYGIPAKVKKIFNSETNDWTTCE